MVRRPGARVPSTDVTMTVIALYDAMGSAGAWVAPERYDTERKSSWLPR